MYLRGMDPFTIASTLLTSAARAGSGSASGASAGGSPDISVSTQTQISPQISPSFVQQDNPQNSPVNTSAVHVATGPMSTPGPTGPGYMPTTGAIPGFDAASGYLPSGLPNTPIVQGAAPLNKNALMLAGLFLGGVVLWKTAGSGRLKKYKSRSHALAVR